MVVPDQYSFLWCNIIRKVSLCTTVLVVCVTNNNIKLDDTYLIVYDTIYVTYDRRLTNHYMKSRWHYTSYPFISYPVISSRSFCPLIHFVPGHFVPVHFVPWSFRPLVISSPRAESTEVHA
jgi:hypothetical protein